MKKKINLVNTLVAGTAIAAITVAASLNAHAEVMTKLLPPAENMLVCSSHALAAEPMFLRQVLVHDAYGKALTSAKAMALFDAKKMSGLQQDSGVSRANVTSSHIVNLLSDEFEKIDRKQGELIRDGKLFPLEEGKTYSASELKRRRESVAKFKQEFVDPVLADLYRIYIQAVRELVKRKTEAKSGGCDKAADLFLGQVKAQREFLQALIKKVHPAIVEKLGDIAPVVKGEDLPISYRDGLIVKIHFQKPGDTDHVTVYPHMLLTQFEGTDQRFITSMQRWKEYCHERLQTALNNDQPEEAKYAKLAYDEATDSLKGALWVHERVKVLNAKDLGSLADLFRALRFGDLPMCQNAITQLNAKMREMLGGASSSADKSITPERKKAVDKFAKDVIFYQDVYTAFSRLSAYGLAK